MGPGPTANGDHYGEVKHYYFICTSKWSMWVLTATQPLSMEGERQRERGTECLVPV